MIKLVWQSKFSVYVIYEQISTEESMVFKGKESLLIPVQAQVRMSYSIYLCLCDLCGEKNSSFLAIISRHVFVFVWLFLAYVTFYIHYLYEGCELIAG